MVSSSMIYTLLFTVGLVVFTASIHAASVHNKDDNDDSAALKMFDEDMDDINLSSLRQRAAGNGGYPDGFQGILLGKRRAESRAIRLPSEAILLGKRRLPVEAVLLGRRDLPNEGILLGKRR